MDPIRTPYAPGAGQRPPELAGRDEVELYLYPNADHGFNCTERASYHQHSAALAHGRTLTFLGERL